MKQPKSSSSHPVSHHRLYQYLSESRAHLLGWVRPLSGEAYAQPHPIGLGSLALTLHHVMAAEWCYMQRVRGVLGPLGPLAREHDPEPAEPMPFRELEPCWAAQQAAVAADLARVTDWNTPLEVVSVDKDGGELRYRASRADLLAQLVLHEVHHRAQAMHMLRRLGVPTGEIDYNTLMWDFSA